jgi:hypothetical protein
LTLLVAASATFDAVARMGQENKGWQERFRDRPLDRL